MHWIATAKEMGPVCERIRETGVIGVDTEADSLHSYFDKVCLIQITADGEDYLIDPLARFDLAELGAILADPSIRKILHGADYDIRILQRDFGFNIAAIEDTMVCAQLLGYPSIGLAALLERHFGLVVDKRHQRADWAMRPLTPSMLDYATLDTRHLVELVARVRAELETKGRWEWATQEFARLETIRFEESGVDDESYRKIKGSNRLAPRALAALQRLHRWRDGLAREMDRPPFRVLPNETLLGIAVELPRDRDALMSIRGATSPHATRRVAELLHLVDEVRRLPEADLPSRTEAQSWVRDKELDRRVDKMKKVRDSIAEQLGIQASLLAPRHVLATIAALENPDVAALAQIDTLRDWQREVAGQAFIDALR